MKKAIIFILISILCTSAYAQKKDDVAAGPDKNGPARENADTKYAEGASGVKRSISYRFNASTGAEDPGSGVFRYNADAISRVSYIYLDNNDLSGDDQTKWYRTWDDTTGATARGQLNIVEKDGKNVNIFYVTGVFSAGDGFWKIPVEYISGSMPADGSVYFYVFNRIARKKDKEQAQQTEQKKEEQVKPAEIVTVAEVIKEETKPVVEEHKQEEAVNPAEKVEEVVAEKKEEVKPVEQVIVEQKKEEVKPVVEQEKKEEIKPVVEQVVEKKEELKPVVEQVIEEKKEEVKPVIEQVIEEKKEEGKPVVEQVVEKKEEVKPVVEQVTEQKKDDVKPVVEQVVEKKEEVKPVVEQTVEQKKEEAKPIIEVVAEQKKEEIMPVVEQVTAEQRKEEPKPEQKIERPVRNKTQVDEVTRRRERPDGPVIETAGNQQVVVQSSSSIVKTQEEQNRNQPERTKTGQQETQVQQKQPDVSQNTQVTTGSGNNVTQVNQNSGNVYTQVNNNYQKYKQIFNQPSDQSAQQKTASSNQNVNQVYQNQQVNQSNQNRVSQSNQVNQNNQNRVSQNTQKYEQIFNGSPSTTDKQVTTTEKQAEKVTRQEVTSAQATGSTLGNYGYHTVVTEESSASYYNSSRKWWHGIIEGGYGLGMGNYGMNNFRINFINAVGIGKCSSIGLGLGFRKYLGYGNPVWYSVSGDMQLPLFVDLRTSFSSRKVTPYLALGAGTSLRIGTSEGVSEGLYLCPSGGIWFNVSEKFAVFLGAAFELQKLEYADYTDDIPYKKNAGSLSINLGISF